MYLSTGGMLRWARSPNLGTGVQGISTSSIGVSGSSSGAQGVSGISGGAAKSGVYGGNSNKNGGFGVHGDCDVAGGVGVYATSTKGIGLAVAGNAWFSASGVQEIPSGSSSLAVNSARATADSIVLATLQGTKGGVVFSVQPGKPSDGMFTVYFAQTTTETLYLGWFVIDNPADVSLPGTEHI
jgi:hypothetical protein